MIIKFLGTGDPLGMPVMTCYCKFCMIARKKLSKRRLRPALLIQNDKRNVIFDCSNDIRIQLIENNIKRINAIFVTHAHFDHFFGLFDILQLNFLDNKRIPVYVSKNILKYIKRTFPWLKLNFIAFENGKNYIVAGISIKPIKVEHTKIFDTFGFIITKEGKKVLYFPDFRKIGKNSIKLMKGADVAVLDGQYISGKYMKDPDHIDGRTLIKYVHQLESKKVFLTSISEHWIKKSDKEIISHLPKNFYIPFDGLSIKI